MTWSGVVLAWEGVVGTRWEGRCAAVLASLDLAALPGDGVVVLDERCPGVGADDVRRVVAAATEGAAAGGVAVGVRPVTDTVKAVEDGFVGDTVDREGLVAVCSPLVVPAALSGAVGGDVPAAVERWLADGTAVVLVEVPVAARRLGGADELVLLGD